MAYSPTIWETGDIVSSEKLNKLENGVANAGGDPFIVHATYSNSSYTLDKSYDQINEVYESKSPCLMVLDGDLWLILSRRVNSILIFSGFKPFYDDDEDELSLIYFYLGIRPNGKIDAINHALI